MLGLAISLVLLVKRATDEDGTVFMILGVLLAVGVGLWFLNRYVFGRSGELDPSELDL